MNVLEGLARCKQADVSTLVGATGTSQRCCPFASSCGYRTNGVRFVCKRNRASTSVPTVCRSWTRLDEAKETVTTTHYAAQKLVLLGH